MHIKTATVLTAEWIPSKWKLTYISCFPVALKKLTWMYYIITFTWRWYFSENLRKKKKRNVGCYVSFIWNYFLELNLWRRGACYFGEVVVYLVPHLQKCIKKKKKRLNDSINLKAQGIQLWAETGSGKTVIVTIFHTVQTGQFLYLQEWLQENVRAPVLCVSLLQLFPLLLCDSHPTGWWESLWRTSIPRTQFSLSDCYK